MKTKPSIIVQFFVRNEQELDMLWHEIDKNHNRKGFIAMSLIYHICSEYLYTLINKAKQMFNISHDNVYDKLQNKHRTKPMVELHIFRDESIYFVIKNRVLIFKLKKHLAKFDIDLNSHITATRAILICAQENISCKKEFLYKIKDEHEKLKTFPFGANICKECEFIDIDANESSLCADKIKCSVISSFNFLEQIIGDKDASYAIIDMIDCIKNMKHAIEKIDNRYYDYYQFTVISKEMSNLSKNLAYFLEFSSVVASIKILISIIESHNGLENYKFFKILDALIADFELWIKIFTGEQRVDDIHYFDDTIVAVISQLQTSLYFKAA